MEIEAESEAESVEEQVIARLDRQQLLCRNPAPTVRIIIDEYGLRRQVGSAKVWEAQPEHPIAIAQLPMVGVRPPGPASSSSPGEGAGPRATVCSRAGRGS
ncbi:Scr1 family TA system antitoxin-like transcriptional regulator [Streptomyces microflavus]|uniref:Scr1 family TA system antitoxin-like transcriptional regulator n=1 Tax=Streptomyces microflavus TaxID=1919 RepID=UPI0036B0D67D